MNLTRKIALTLAVGIAGTAAITTSAMIADQSEHGVRTVNFNRGEPCSTCGRALPVTITCDGIDWNIYDPGTVPDVAASVCQPGATYTWKVNR